MYSIQETFVDNRFELRKDGYPIGMIAKIGPNPDESRKLAEEIVEKLNRVTVEGE